MDIEKLKRNKVRFRSMCGMTVTQFEALLPLFADRLLAHLSQWTWDGLGRRNAYPPDPRFTPDRLLMLAPVRLRKGADQTVLAEMFETTRATVCGRLEVLTDLALGALEEFRPQGADGFFGVKSGGNQTIAIDGTERPVERPGKNQRDAFSVKSHDHCVKNGMALNVETVRILWLGLTEPGSRHDKTICDGLIFEEGTVLLCDLAYLGYKAKNAEVLVPHKKPKGGQLTDEQKRENRKHSRRRIAVEHAFARLKAFKILSYRLRGRMSRYADIVIGIVASICNFQLVTT